MKAKRRQELKSNDLAQMLDDLRDSFNRWGVYILAGVAVVLVVYAIATSIRSARSAQIDNAYDELVQAMQIAPGGIRKSDEDIQQGLDKMKRLAAESDDPEFKLDALYRRSELGLGLALNDPEGPKMGYLQAAKDAFKSIIADFPDRKIYVGRAYHGLFQVEATMFAIDGDMSHKTEALKDLEAIRDDPAFAQTPLMAAALDRINEIDTLFVPIKFPKAPAQEASDEATGAAGAQMPTISSPSDAGKVDVVPINPPNLELPPKQVDSSPAEKPEEVEKDKAADDDEAADEPGPVGKPGAVDQGDADEDAAAGAPDDGDAEDVDTNG